MTTMKKKITYGGGRVPRGTIRTVPKIMMKSALSCGLSWIIAVNVFCHLWSNAPVQAQVMDRK